MADKPRRRHDSTPRPALGTDVAVDRFLNYLATERGVAANTVLAYGRDLASFVNHCERRHLRHVAAIQVRDVVSFLESLRYRHLGRRGSQLRDSGGRCGRRLLGYNSYARRHRRRR